VLANDQIRIQMPSFIFKDILRNDLLHKPYFYGKTILPQFQ